MPPRRNVPASPASTSAGRQIPPSPARSTRSTRSRMNGDEDDFEDNVSLASSSFRNPVSKTKKFNGLGLNNTSVNIATAFHNAKSANDLPTPNSDRPFPPISKAPPKAKSPPVQRALSPSEQLASVAKAVRPASFFLLAPKDNYDGEDPDHYNSFSSLDSANKSAETSYDYRQEEDFVRAARTAAGPRVSDPKKRRKAADEDAAYRPGEDDYTYHSDESGGEGEGLVQGGALDGRAGTRGKRPEKGEGYLGTGLGLQPKTRRRSRRSGNGIEGGSDDEDDPSQRGHSPTYEILQTPMSRHRSPTPAELLRRLTPQLDRRSPAPIYPSRKRQPSSLRTVITNLLHGIALGLQIVVEFLTGLITKPIRTVLGSGKSIARRAKRDWWKWLGALLALSLALRVLDRSRRPTNSYHAPELPPGSVDELVARLTSLEQALAVLSESSKIHTQAEKESKRVSESISGRITKIEGNIKDETKRNTEVQRNSDDGVTALKQSFEGLKQELGSLSSRVTSQDRAISSAESRATAIASVDREVQALKVRVGQVEQEVKDAFGDGRLRSAIERILPRDILVKINSGGTVDIDPSFWAEMKKVLVGKNEVDQLVRKAIGDVSRGATDVVGRTEKELEEWGERLFARKSSSGVIISRSDFMGVLESEVKALRHLIDHHKPSTGKTSPSSVTIKSNKGDDLTSLFNDLINAALLKYSKDTIAKPDYALFSAGGRIVPSITSDTLVMRSPSLLGKVLLGRKDVEGRSPATALHPDNSVGSCWPFQGEKGQLGVLLNRRIVVGDVTVEHAAKELAMDTSSAPRNIEVWALVEGKENKAKVEAYLASNPQTENGSMQSTNDHLLLTTFTYDPNASSHIQTFPIPPEIVDLGIDVGIVIFKVESNWGGKFTCLYRVRVHGEVASV